MRTINSEDCNDIALYYNYRVEKKKEKVTKVPRCMELLSYDSGRKRKRILQSGPVA